MLRYMILHHVGFPIRKSVGRSLFAAHHSLSQLVTSFVGSWCQGIHLTLLFAWTSCIVPILWFSLNCLSFLLNFRSAEHFRSGFYWLLFAVKKQFTRLLHFVLSCAFAPSTFRWNCMHTFMCAFPFRLERLIYLFRFICPLLFVFYSKNFSSIRLSKIFLHSLRECWSVWMDSNHRPRAYQARALATWATNRNLTHRLYDSFIFSLPLCSLSPRPWP